MDKLKYIFSFVICYIIFRIIFNYNTNENFNEHLVDTESNPSQGQFIVPVSASSDNTVQTNGYVGRYILIRPSTNLGDGWVGVTQLVVNDMNGNNIAKGKPYYTTSSYPGSNPGYSVVDGIIKPRVDPGLWNPLTGNRETEYLEIDLGAPVAISSVRILSQDGAFTSTSTPDRTSQVRIGLNLTSKSAAALAAYATQTTQNNTLISESNSGKEVYRVSANVLRGGAQAICSAFGGTLATLNQLQYAHMNGFQACEWGWIADSNTLALLTQEYPYPKPDSRSGWCGGLGLTKWVENPPTSNRAVYCYGVKPASGTANVKPFFESNTTPKSKPDIWNSPTIGNVINVMVTQPNGTIVSTPCNAATCKINCKLTYTPSGSCILVSKK